MVRILLITKEAAISLILYNLLKVFYREDGTGGGWVVAGLSEAKGVWLMVRPSQLPVFSNPLSALESRELSEGRNCAHRVCRCIPRAQHKGLTL